MLQNKRITVVDALRGATILSIMLLHNIEQFGANNPNPVKPEWISGIDIYISNTIHTLFGGKSYAIFALLFGLTFFIQTKNQEKDGKDFKIRFIWRLTILFGFGIINTLFYSGEILILYALLGLFLIPFNKMGNRTILIIAIILLLQPLMCVNAIIALNNPDLQPKVPLYWPYFLKSQMAWSGNSLLYIMKSNIKIGRIASLLFYWEEGRIEQTLGLFLMGFLAGRKKIFMETPENIKFWKKILLISVLIYVPFIFFKHRPEIFSSSLNISTSLGRLFELWSNLAFTFILISVFILLFYNVKFQPALDKLSPIGKMSLSNYILQSILGSFVYYGFGLGLYKYTGATYSLFIGIILAIAQGLFSSYWFKNHKRGPLESLWHKLTWLGTDKK